MTDMGYRLSKIYTRTGDAGQTGLADGRRVPKDHPRIEAIGEVDSLNSLLGVLLAELDEARARHPGLAELIEVLTPCQHRLFDLGGELLAYLNRLSDLFFVAARLIARRQGVAEVLWQAAPKPAR